MRLFSIRKTEIRLHPLVFVVIAGAFVLGRANDFLMAVLALLLHELAHAIVSCAFGCTLLAVEILPFGGVARIRHANLSPYAEFCIACAGPVASVVLGGMTAAAGYFFPAVALRLRAFLAFNLTLAAVNLLPALPLDGGRMLRCLLEQRMQKAKATRITCWSGVFFGASLLGLCAYGAARGTYNYTLPVMGFFLLFAALMELRRAPEAQLSAFLRKNDGVRAGESVTVREIAAHESMAAEEAVRILSANRYNVLRVLDASMRTLGEIDEGRLLVGIARFGTGVSVGEILAFDRSGRM